MARSRFHTVTGPGVEKVCKHGAGAALSAAQTIASRSKVEATFYVRDEDGVGIGRTERTADGIVYVYGPPESTR